MGIYKSTAKNAQKYFSHANHIYYQKIESCVSTSFSDIIKNSFTIKLQSFSGIDTKVRFDVNVFKNVLQSNEMMPTLIRMTILGLQFFS